MSPVSTISASSPLSARQALRGPGGAGSAAAGNLLSGPGTQQPAGRTEEPRPAGFGSLFGHLVGGVQERQDRASAITRQVMLGESGQIHQSVIAMQEASVAFALMVEIRNKLVEVK